MPENHPLDPADALRKAVDIAGSQSAMGRLLGVSQHAVWQWLKQEKPLPDRHVLLVERETGVSRHVLRPDLYPRDLSARSGRDHPNHGGFCDAIGEPAR